MNTKFQKRDILKMGIESVVGYGVGFITTSAIERIIPHNLSAPKKIAIRVSSFAVSWAVTTAAAKNINVFIDALADGINVGYSSAKAEQQTVSYASMEEYMAADTVSPLHINPDNISNENKGETDEH